VVVTIELINLTRNPFTANIDRVEKIPPALEAYREKRDEEGNPIPGALPLGGWSAHLRVRSAAAYQGQSSVVEQVRDIRIIDITPPAPDHTLFIHSAFQMSTRWAFGTSQWKPCENIVIDGFCVAGCINVFACFAV